MRLPVAVPVAVQSVPAATAAAAPAAPPSTGVAGRQAASVAPSLSAAALPPSVPTLSPVALAPSLRVVGVASAAAPSAVPTSPPAGLRPTVPVVTLVAPPVVTAVVAAPVVGPPVVTATVTAEAAAGIIPEERSWWTQDSGDLPAELRLAEERVRDLRKQRAAQVAELTRLAEALTSARGSRAEAEREIEDMKQEEAEWTGRVGRAQEVYNESRERVEYLKARCVELQATPLEAPEQGLEVAPQAQKLADHTMQISHELRVCKEKLQKKQEMLGELQANCGKEERALERLRKQVRTLEQVYEDADRQLGASADGDPEAVVLVLARTVLPLVPFTTAEQALHQLHQAAGSQAHRPALLPAHAMELHPLHVHPQALLPAA